LPKIAVDEIAFAGNDAAPDAFAFFMRRREDAYGFTMVKGEPLGRAGHTAHRSGDRVNEMSGSPRSPALGLSRM